MTAPLNSRVNPDAFEKNETGVIGARKVALPSGIIRNNCVL